MPPGVVTETLPEEPIAGTAEMEVGLITLKEAAAVPPKLTADALVKFAPVMFTVDPEVAVVGVNDVIVGMVDE